MRLTRSLLALALSSSLVLPVVLTTRYYAVAAQDTNAAIQRGYRTGYSDGYMAGYRDSIDSLERSISRHREYETADRAYNKDYGSLEDYRDGYRQGFQIGYETGFNKSTFESTVPADLVRGGGKSTKAATENKAVEPLQSQTATNPSRQTEIETPVSIDQRSEDKGDADTADAADNKVGGVQAVIRKASYRDDDAIVLIPKDTEILLELQADLSTDSTRTGERFTARVLSPMELDGAIVEGHVEKIQIPGRIKRTAELQLSFDRIVLNETRWSNFNALLVEVVPMKGDNIRRVTDEGTAIGQSSVKGDAIKIGGATGTGAGVGAIVGGPIGAAVGAGIGAALGIGAAVTDHGKHIRISKNQQLRVRSSYEAQIR